MNATSTELAIDPSEQLAVQGGTEIAIVLNGNEEPEAINDTVTTVATTQSLPHSITPLNTHSDLASAWQGFSQPTCYTLHLAEMRLVETKELVENSTTGLSNQFNELAQATAEQSSVVERIVQEARILHIDGNDITIEEFGETFSEALSETIEKIVLISREAMKMVYSLAEAINMLTEIEKFTTSIKAINRQTNILSLNATIEAARAGVHGQGFAVVAEEVRNVSNQISQLANDMQQKISLVVESVRNGYNLLEKVATTNIQDTVDRQETLSQLMNALLEKTDNFQEVLKDSADSSMRFSNTLSGMVMSIQFQDRTSQYITNIVDALRITREAVEGLSNAGKSTDLNENTITAMQDHISQAVINVLQLSEFQNSYTNDLVEAGILKTSDVESTVQNADADDDIELF